MHPIWIESSSILKAVSSFIANVVGTGLNEETFFRGFLFTQLFLYFRKFRQGSAHQLIPFLPAAIVSSVLFALCHFQFNVAAFSFFMIGGMLGCWIYYVTNNIFYGIILHGFFNAPLPLIECSDDLAKIIVFNIITIIVCTQYFKRRVTNV
jgi:membrane protease YdiL (CAAX protease family)